MFRTRWAAFCGLFAAAWAVAVPTVFGLLRPGYSQVGQYISELGEVGAPYSGIVNLAGFLPIGLAVWAFLLLARPGLPRGRLADVGLAALAGVGLAYLIAAFCPCEPGCPTTGPLRQQIHNLGGLAEYGGAFVGFLLCARAFRTDPQWRRLGPVSLAAAGIVGLGFVLLSSPANLGQKGLWQRVCEATIFGWIAVVSLRLMAEALRGARREGNER